MTSRSDAAVRAARRLWANALGERAAANRIPAAADQMFKRLRIELGRWIGSHGYQLLLERSLREAEAEHRALTGLACLGEDCPALGDAVRTHGPGDVGAGLVTLVTVLIDLLGRIVGEEMAIRLVEQSGKPSPRGAAGPVAEGGRDG
jgi:hypothetical protein